MYLLNCQKSCLIGGSHSNKEAVVCGARRKSANDIVCLHTRHAYHREAQYLRTNHRVSYARSQDWEGRLESNSSVRTTWSTALRSAHLQQLLYLGDRQLQAVRHGRPLRFVVRVQLMPAWRTCTATCARALMHLATTLVVYTRMCWSLPSNSHDVHCLGTIRLVPRMHT